MSFLHRWVSATPTKFVLTKNITLLNNYNDNNIVKIKQ